MSRSTELPDYKLLTYRRGQEARAAIMTAGKVYDLSDLSGHPADASLLGMLQDWPSSADRLRTVARLASDSVGASLESFTLETPILYPHAVYCAGANYLEHIRNMEHRLGLTASPNPREQGGRPFHFLKPSRSCVATGQPVRAPSAVLDWEGELVAVIGRETRNVSVEQALASVAGYTVGNDLSARDIGWRSEYGPDSVFRHSWLDHKGFEGSAPVGPWITPAHQVADPQALRLRTWVNGILKQDATTGDMLFSVAEQIAYLSSLTTLWPGDIVMTGTPAGVGSETGEKLSPGDEVVVEIEGLGRLVTPII